jgi:ATP phosphoribosyltransferase regulatory subunit HisZ
LPLVFIPRDKVFEAALERAGEAGPVPDDLRAAFSDRAVLAAHVFELVGVFVVFALMVGKPF